MQARQKASNKARHVAARLLARKPITVTPAQPILSISFDDVLADATHAGLDVMQKHDIIATWYVAPGLFGGSWNCGVFSDAEDIRRLSDAGQHIAAHGISHRMVNSLSEQEILQEDRQCREQLEQITSRPASPHYAYPEGVVTATAKKLIGKRHCTMRSTNPGIMRGRCDAAMLNGNALYGDVDALANTRTLLDDLANQPGWLILYSHDIRDNPSIYGATAGLLDATVLAARERDISILSVEQAWGLLTES